MSFNFITKIPIDSFERPKTKEELARLELGYRMGCIDECDPEYETKVWAILTYVRIKYKVVIYAWELGLHEFPPMYKFAKVFNGIEPLDLSDMLKGD